MLRVGRPMLVVVLKAWVTEMTNLPRNLRLWHNIPGAVFELPRWRLASFAESADFA